LGGNKHLETTKPQANKSGNNVRLEAELERLKRKLGLCWEVSVKWLPEAVKFRDGKRLEEEVVSNIIFIYEENPNRAKELLAHGLAEWLLNQHTKKYRLFINKLIELFEQIQYQEKEKIADTIAKLIENKNST